MEMIRNASDSRLKKLQRRFSEAFREIAEKLLESYYGNTCESYKKLPEKHYGKPSEKMMGSSQEKIC